MVAPHELPMEWASWSPARQDTFNEHRAPASYQLLYDGPGGSNGLVGDALPAERAVAIIATFTGAPTMEKMDATGLYDGAGWCPECRGFYCPKHWSISTSGYGVCPNGHGKSLDPHWSQGRF
ncbi:MAG: hypothetical protein ACRDQZ_15495 [Mycobacteriales bacterium]